MKKQELIKHIEDLPYKEGPIVDKIDISRKGLLELVKQLDEPQPVQVPQFVADWIEYCKVKKITLAHALYRSEEAENKNVFSWIVKDSGNQETFARAWLDGYEVEKEKRYLVKVKGMSEENTYLTFRFGHAWMLSNFEECEEFRLHHTRKQLEEADFGWVFDCPGMEIQEVE